MVFKLEGSTHSTALALDGAQLFDPSKKGRAMKAWVQVPYGYHDQWAGFCTTGTFYKSLKIENPHLPRQTGIFTTLNNL